MKHNKMLHYFNETKYMLDRIIRVGRHCSGVGLSLFGLSMMLGQWWVIALVNL